MPSRAHQRLCNEAAQLDAYLRHLSAVAVSCGTVNEEAMAHVEEAIELLEAQRAALEARFVALDAEEEMVAKGRVA